MESWHRHTISCKHRVPTFCKFLNLLMLRLGRRVWAGSLRKKNSLHCANELLLNKTGVPALSRSAATTSTSSASTKGAPPPPRKAASPSSKRTLGLKPRPAAADAGEERTPHAPKQPLHGRLTKKSRPRKLTPWVRPARPRGPTLRSRSRREARQARLGAVFADPRARVARYRLGFHVLHHAQPLKPLRRGRLSREIRAKIEERGDLQSRRNRKRYGRPDISLKHPKRWNPPLPAGVLPAYDEALKVIRADAYQLRTKAQAQRKEVARLHKILCGELEGVEPVVGEARIALEQELEKMREMLHILDVQSEVNLPEVRWSVANAMTDMTIPSHRHLLEQRWRSEGDLDLLMERVHQMNVIPDALPVMHPTVDLHLTAPLMQEHFDKLMRRNRGPSGLPRRMNTFKDVIPGNYLVPKQTREPPKMYANVFHTDVRLYTMLMVDLDVPDPENQTYTTFLHWMKPNIPLSATHAGRIPFLNTHTQYVPPHPQKGTPYHRYVTLLLPHPPMEGFKYNRNTEALMTEKQAALSQSLTLSAAERERAAKTVAAVSAAVPNVTRRAFAHRPTHPNARISLHYQLANFTTISQELDIPVVPMDARVGFDIRAFVKEWGMNAAMGGGMHMFREVWDTYVSGIYKYTLQEAQPEFGRPRRINPNRKDPAVEQRPKYRIDA
ncbi:unnamed protein product [Mycena citricolor]|uniref:PEBP-like protein n=1 Tax=Mycena citricolor TaxID=2018698 RepID=A0AAD2Q5X7_9AGAR|nr:unnamed protein product [Mycena citricolor]